MVDLDAPHDDDASDDNGQDEALTDADDADARSDETSAADASDARDDMSRDER